MKVSACIRLFNVFLPILDEPVQMFTFFKLHKASYRPLLASRMKTRLLPRGFVKGMDLYGTSFVLCMKHADGTVRKRK